MSQFMLRLFLLFMVTFGVTGFVLLVIATSKFVTQQLRFNTEWYEYLLTIFVFCVNMFIITLYLVVLVLTITEILSILV